MASGLVGDSTVSRHDLRLATADVIITAAWIIGGVLLWRRQALGYVSGTGLLFQGSMLFIGLILFFLLQPLLTGADFALTDAVVTFAMGFVCFIPFGLFVRGVIRS